MILRVLTNTVATTVRACGMMYKAVAQSVIMYDSESLVLMGAMLKVLEEFHHRAYRRITGMTAKHLADGEC